MVKVRGKTEEDKQQRDLGDRVFSLACEMFGGDNVRRFTDTYFFICDNMIMVELYNLNNGIVRVKSPEYKDKAMEFAKRYELEIIGREDGVLLDKDYFE